MDLIFDYFDRWWDSGKGASWRWFNSLSTDEWIIVLGVTFAVGMLMLRGMGKRRI